MSRKNPVIEGRELSIKGSFLSTARLRHEWCDFVPEPASMASAIQSHRIADLFTFVTDVGHTGNGYPYHNEPVGVAVLPLTTYEAWWEEIGKKKRNQIRKAQKSGVELRPCKLDTAFAQAVEPIYNECPVRQGRKFYHYGQTAAEIEAELSSFPEQTILVGAFVDNVMVGFMKLFRAEHALRIVHILAKLSERDKCVMDALIGKAVELCIEHKYRFLQYGSWTDNGIGAFRTKHGFQRIEVPRYFVPLNWRGRLILTLKLHRPVRERLPDAVVNPLMKLRARWNALRFSAPKEFADA